MLYPHDASATRAGFWLKPLLTGDIDPKAVPVTSACLPQWQEGLAPGLLRFIGRLAINQAVANLRGGLFWVGAESITEWELDNVGMVQAQAGAMLLTKWRFSPAIVQAIAAQDAPAVGEEGTWLAEALFFTSAMLPQGLGTPFLPAVGPTWWSTPPIGSDFMHQHDLTPVRVEAILQSTSQAFDEIRQNFGS